MKFKADRPYADPENAAQRLMEHARAFHPIQDGRIYIEELNSPFLYKDRGSPAEYGRSAVRNRATLVGYHESGTFVRFMQKGSELFALDGRTSLKTPSPAASLRSTRLHLPTHRRTVMGINALIYHRRIQQGTY